MSGEDEAVSGEVVDAMIIDRIKDQDYWTAESLDDLRDWEIIYREPWTEAVSRLHCRRPFDTASMEFQIIYCRTAILKEVIEVETLQ